ncbi:HAMP domain-containing sensor histidine kinase [Phycicoccus sp. M110.8]|uniref:sensor histidine kinase n=1 Tax=Phycicoccus sp. M110.8 TaxID=3075433 RepID=UPI0028FDAA94|nr:HAMP domain-containing sensor histidine kinase [Phycicoccus sp. M110.8]MDU0315276.1 HAMP domain-containing sensor histidine kinase [Phycicoccus sp. M110.8]
MPAQLSAVALSAAVALVTGLLGVAAVVRLARRSLGAAAVAAPVVVVLAVAAGVYASSRAMFLRTEDSTTVLLVLLAAVPVAAVLGGLVARRVIAADRLATTERMQRQQEARSESDRRELVAWVSHDLRTPLAGIRAISEAVEDGVATDVPAAMRMVRDSVVRMGDLVDSLLALSRLQADGPGVQVGEVDLGDLVSDTVASLSPLAQQRGIRLTGSAAPGVRATVAAGDVQRAVANLVVNAIRHTHGEVVTTVTAAASGDVLVTVEDQCGGIPADVIGRVFETGFRGSGARTPGDGGGSGLGLAIVAGVARAHGGTATVVNTADGCRFCLRLPVVPAQHNGP